jgi:hypothetical protein
MIKTSFDLVLIRSQPEMAKGSLIGSDQPHWPPNRTVKAEHELLPSPRVFPQAQVLTNMWLIQINLRNTVLREIHNKSKNEDEMSNDNKFAVDTTNAICTYPSLNGQKFWFWTI